MTGPPEAAAAGISLKGSRRGFAGASPGRDRSRLPRPAAGSPGSANPPDSAYTDRLFVHQLRVTDFGQLDDEFARWVREAYDVGSGAHLK